jgi:NAD(P)-dependent dehydrogenase (short-subunit alcohol dehydrogenase family)
MSVALITGGSAGLGRALAHALADEGWRVIVDARDADRLAAATDRPEIVAVPGDLADDWHRGAIVAAVEREGRLDLLVHNASTLGPVPMPRLDAATLHDFEQVWRVNMGAPLALTADLLPRLRASRGTLLSISSDAGVEHYEGWGLYGATKAGLDHLTLTFGAENPEIRAYAVDPGDMRTAMHQAAFPGEDISDRPLPETVVPRLLALLESRPPSGRYRAADVPVAEKVGG